MAGIGLLNEELRRYDSDLATKPQILAVTKSDAVTAPEVVDRIRKHAEEQRLPCLVISSVSGDGIPGLVRTLGAWLDRAGEDGAAADEAPP